MHLTLQLLDRYLSTNVMTRRKYQTVGVTAFMLGCKYDERHNYITDYSSSRQDIIDIPFSKAAGTSTSHDNDFRFMQYKIMVGVPTPLEWPRNIYCTMRESGARRVGRGWGG